MNVVRLLLTLLFLSSCQNPMTETGYSVAELNHVEFSYKDANGTMYLRSPTYIAPTYFDDHGFEASCSTEPALPEGLYVEQKTCAITGTPVQMMKPTNYKVIAINAAGQTSANVTISVGPGKPTLEYPEKNQGLVNIALSLSPSVFFNNGSPLKSCLSEPALPDGLVIDQQTCEISGTPIAFRSEATYFITAINEVGKTEAALKLRTSGLPRLSYENVSGLVKVGFAFRAQPSSLNAMGDSITSCVISPELPAGLEIDNTSCVISGTARTPTALSSYTITASNAVGPTTASFDLEVLPSPPILSYKGNNGQGRYSFPLTVVPSLLSSEGSPITNCIISPALPTGLTLHPQTCEISGVPEAVITPSNFLVTVSNAIGSSDAVVNIEVVPSAPVVGFSSTVYSKFFGDEFTLAPSTLRSNGAFITNCSITPELPEGVFLNPYSCEIKGFFRKVSPLKEYTFYTTNSAGTVTTTFSLEVKPITPEISYDGSTGKTGSAQSFQKVIPRTVSSGGDAVFSCSISPDLPEGLSLDPRSCIISGTPPYELPSTTFTVTLTNSMGSGTGTLVLRINPIPPEISYDAYTGKAEYTLSIVPSLLNKGGTTITSCTISPALPAGLSINNTTCEISGKHMFESALKTYTITVKNSAGTSSGTFDFDIEAIPPEVSYEAAIGKMENAITITPTDLKKGGSYITGCDTSPALPEGLSIDPVTCVITGTPVGMSDETYLVTLTNPIGSGNTNLPITIGPNFPILTFESAAGMYDVPMEVSPSYVHLRGAPITRCSASPELPPGLTLAQDSCVISGIPKASMDATTYTLTFANAGGENTATVTLSLAPNIPVVDPYVAESFTAKFGEPFLLTSSIRERGNTISNCTISPALPSGLSLDPLTCNISGTPDVISDQITYTVIATNSAGASAGGEVSFNILPNTPLLGFDNNAIGAMGDPLEVTPTLYNNRGNPVTSCTISPALPSTLSVDSETCVISGTPLALLEETEYTLTASNAVGSVSATVSILVGPRIPFVNLLGNNAASYPGSGTTWHSLVYPWPALLYGPTYTSAAGGGMNFDGVNDYAIISPTKTYTPFGLEFWVKVNCHIQANDSAACSASGKTHQSLGGWDNTAGVHLGGWTSNATNEVISIISKDGKVTYLNEALPIGFYHLFINWNGSHYDIWVNGVKKDVIAGTTGHASLDADLAETFWLGTVKNDSSSSAYNFFGTLFEFRLWNSLVPDSEITNSFDATKARFAPTLSFSGSGGTTGYTRFGMGIAPTTTNHVATSCTSSPGLPAGLGLNLANCSITGTPSGASNNTYTITATNNFGSVSSNVTLRVYNSVYCPHGGYDHPRSYVRVWSDCSYYCPGRGYDGPSSYVKSMSSCTYYCPGRGYDGPSYHVSSMGSCTYDCRTRGFDYPTNQVKSMNDCRYLCTSHGYDGPSSPVSALSSCTYDCRTRGFDHPTNQVGSMNDCRYLCASRGFDGPSTPVTATNQCTYTCTSRGFDAPTTPVSSLSSCTYNCIARGYDSPTTPVTSLTACKNTPPSLSLAMSRSPYDPSANIMITMNKAPSQLIVYKGSNCSGASTTYSNPGTSVNFAYTVSSFGTYYASAKIKSSNGTYSDCSSNFSFSYQQIQAPSTTFSNFSVTPDGSSRATWSWSVSTGSISGISPGNIKIYIRVTGTPKLYEYETSSTSISFRGVYSTDSYEAYLTQKFSGYGQVVESSPSSTIPLYGCKNKGYDEDKLVTSLSSCGYSCPSRGFDGPSGFVSSLSSCGYSCIARGYEGPTGYVSSLSSCYRLLSQDYGKMTWNDARSFCQSKGGYLPSIGELHSYYKLGFNFRSGASSSYNWSSTSYHRNNDYAERLRWSDGTSGLMQDLKTNTNSVRCVFP